MTKRIISLLVLVVMMVSMLPVTAHADEGLYIESVAIAKHESSASSAKKALTDAGYTVIDKDLNAGCNTLFNKTDYIYMGYKRTNIARSAITGLMVSSYPTNRCDESFTENGITFWLVGSGKVLNGSGQGVVDLNAGCGEDSNYIYLYVTYDPAYGSPLTDLAIRSGKGNTSLDGYRVVNTRGHEPADLNEEAGGDYIYLFERVFNVKVNISIIRYWNGGTDTLDKLFHFSYHTDSEVVSYPSAGFEYNGASWERVGYREDDTVAPPELEQYFQVNYLTPNGMLLREIYQTTNTLRFNANGGTNAPGSLSDVRYLIASRDGLKESSVTFTIPSGVPSHSGKCAFLGWSTDKYATQPQYQPGDQLTLKANATLYAVWRNHTCESGWSGDSTNHWKECSLCGAKVEEAAHTYTDGVCDVCGAYQSAPEVNETYEISTANQLFWFAQEVNSGNTAINGKLVADIDLEGREWVPIGTQSNPFTGTFDGQGHSIKNFKMTITKGGFYGLFGSICDSVVRNFSISGEMVIDQPEQLELYCGVIGKAAATNADCTVENVHSSVNVKIRDGYNKNCVAGIIGNGEGKSNSPWYKLYIRRCSYSGTMDYGSAYVDCGGGIMGYGNYNGAIYISQCQFSGKILSASAAGGQVGGIMGYNRGQNLRIHGCLSLGQIQMANAGFTGALAGRYLVTGTDFFSNQKAWNNYYTGELAPFSNNTDTSASYNNIDIVDYEQYQSSEDSIARHVTDAQLASGEVAYLLRQNYGSASLYGAADWGQTIGVDAQPVLGGASVYYGYTTCGEDQPFPVYTNEQTVSDKPAHSCGDDNICDNCGFVCAHTAFADGVCTVCGYVCTHDTFVDGECPCGAITGGYCGAEEDGKNLAWTLVDGTLTIAGEGAMMDYDLDALFPAWYDMADQIQTIMIEDGVTTIGVYAFAFCEEVKEARISDSVTSIGMGSFGVCTSLEHITIPAKVTVIPEMAFVQCENLKSVTFNGDIVAIENEAFADCFALSNITLPDRLETIGGKAFYQCGDLQEVVIPDNVTLIGSDAFSACLSLKNVTIGRGVTRIENRAFENCDVLENLTWLAENEVTLGNSVFGGRTNTENIDLTLTSASVGQMTDDVTWNGYTFKSIQIICSDGTLDHTFGYTDNGDATHQLACTDCGYATEVEAHSYDADTMRCICGRLAEASLSKNGIVVGFTTLEEAFDEAEKCTEEDHAIVKLHRMITRNSTGLKVESGVFTLDLNGQTLTGDSYFLPMVEFSNCKAEICDSIGGGRIYNTASLAYTLELDGEGTEVTINSGVIVSKRFGVLANRDGLLTINGGTFILEGSNSFPTHVIYTYHGTVIINGGTLQSPSTTLNNNGGTIVLNLSEGSDTGATFPNKLSVSGTTLNEILAEGAAYWSKGQQLNIADDATYINGEITVMKACGHEDGDCTFVDNGNGTHSGSWTCCGMTVTNQPHSYADGMCICGKMQFDITQQPADFVGMVGDMATFTVEAEGKGLTYQWFFSKDGGETWEKSSCTKNTLTVEFKAYRLNYQYRCEITDSKGNTLVSNAAVLAAQEMELVLLTQPVGYVGAVNDDVTFTVEATGNGLTYEWFFSTDYGETWAKSYSPGYMTNTLAPILRAYRDGYMYKCVVTDVLGNSVESEAVSMTVEASDIIIVKQPQPVVNAISGELYDFSVVAEGDNLTYRWELSTDGGETWQESWNQGYNTPNLSVRMNPNRDGNLYRCVIVSGQKVIVVSEAVVLDMQDPSVELIGQSGSIYITVNQTAAFTVEAEGMDLTYLWYRSDDKGATWYQTYLSGYNTNTLSFVGTADRAAMYMCKITDGSGKVIWSDPVKLQVLSAELKILTQPEDVTCASGETAAFTVEAQGDGLKYQWYYSADGGETWVMSYLTGYNTETLSFYVNASRASRIYKCVITDRDGVALETDAVSVNLG